MFVRIKKIKGKEYGYIVQNKWKRNKQTKKKTSKQKVKAYLGRVHKMEREKELEFFETVNADPGQYLELGSKEKILHDLVRFELLRHGFRPVKGKAKDRYEKNEVVVDIFKNKVMNKQKSKCVLAINEGHLCGYRLRRLGRFNPIGGIEESGLELATLFIESGINIPQEVFIEYYDKC